MYAGLCPWPLGVFVIYFKSVSDERGFWKFKMVKEQDVYGGWM